MSADGAATAGVKRSGRKPHVLVLKMAKRDVKSLEAKGLAVAAVLTLIFLVIRYWHRIPWSAR